MSEHIAQLESTDSQFGLILARCEVTGITCYYGVYPSIEAVGPGRLDLLCEGQHRFKWKEGVK